MSPPLKISLSMIDDSPKPAERRQYDISEAQAGVIDALHKMGMPWLAYAAKSQWEFLERVPLAPFPEELHEEIIRGNEDIIR
jgi:hypothetical protein